MCKLSQEATSKDINIKIVPNPFLNNKPTALNSVPSLPVHDEVLFTAGPAILNA